MGDYKHYAQACKDNGIKPEPYNEWRKFQKYLYACMFFLFCCWGFFYYLIYHHATGTH